MNNTEPNEWRGLRARDKPDTQYKTDGAEDRQVCLEKSMGDQMKRDKIGKPHHRMIKS